MQEAGNTALYTGFVSCKKKKRNAKNMVSAEREPIWGSGGVVRTTMKVNGRGENLTPPPKNPLTDGHQNLCR